jgi:uncharacterized protein (DUF302 family)
MSGWPRRSHRSLHSEIDIGSLLPCNAIVYESAAQQSVVAAMAPMSMIGIVGEILSSPRWRARQTSGFVEL